MLYGLIVQLTYHHFLLNLSISCRETSIIHYFLFKFAVTSMQFIDVVNAYESNRRELLCNRLVLCYAHKTTGLFKMCFCNTCKSPY